MLISNIVWSYLTLWPTLWCTWNHTKFSIFAHALFSTQNAFPYTCPPPLTCSAGDQRVSSRMGPQPRRPGEKGTWTLNPGEARRISGPPNSHAAPYPRWATGARLAHLTNPTPVLESRSHCHAIQLPGRWDKVCEDLAPHQIQMEAPVSNGKQALYRMPFL